MIVPTTARATNYECNTEQVILWKNGRLVEQTPKTYAWIHSIIQFNAETGDMWAAMDKDSNFGPMRFKILRKYEPEKELFAVYDGSDDSPSAGSTFRLRGWDKDTGLVFLLDSTSIKAISTGKCHVYNEPFYPPITQQQ